MEHFNRIANYTIKSKFKFSFNIILIYASTILYFAAAVYFAYKFFSGGDFYFGNENFLMFLIFAAVFTLFLFIIFTQIKIINIDEEGIEVINILFKSKRKKFKWNYFTCFITVDEKSDSRKFEAVWLIKKDKLILRFSEFYYSNYSELKQFVKLEYCGKPYINDITLILTVIFGKRLDKSITEKDYDNIIFKKNTDKIKHL
ncbi:MAG: hypothetical protein GXO50_02765 [Chlorobi bacterium]|nr:hypothetical protein [Chlorobiota bacterium]